VWLPLPAALHRAEDHPGAGLLIGCWAPVGVLLNISKSSGTVIGADWLWAVIAFALAQLAYLEACPVDHGTGSRSQIRIDARSSVPW
jgi:hypothetical protein